MKAITVENLSKIYSVTTAQDQGVSFREMLTGQIQSFFKKGLVQEPFYALKDVSFEVEQGEILGIIGKNGSGKSTLLKILSKITAPTSGRAIVRGRVASLLEVGTGFHAELSGRENIFMSGIILGMKRWEINKHFDEIVSFSGVEKFLDMPVKKYSSGMRLRLAFSVAAHLQPEILLVDEVLAVGDYEFEKKCVNSIKKFNNNGRTTLFVSHSIVAIQRLCKKCLVLSNGQIDYFGNVSTAISRHFGKRKNNNERVWGESEAPGDDSIKILQIKTVDDNQISKEDFDYQDPVNVLVIYKVYSQQEMFSIMLSFYNEEGILLFSSIDTGNKNWRRFPRKKGTYKSICVVPGHLFKSGNITVTVSVITTDQGPRFQINDVITFSIIDTILIPAVVGDWNWVWPNTAVKPIFNWMISQVEGINEAKE